MFLIYLHYVDDILFLRPTDHKVLWGMIQENMEESEEKNLQFIVRTAIATW